MAHGPKLGITPAERIAEEEAAIQAAASELLKCIPSAGVVHALDPKNAEVVARAVISRWIISRVLGATAQRIMHDKVVFDLSDARIRGVLTAALPQIGGAVTHLPADRPFWELDKDQVLDLGVAFVRAAQAGHVGLGEFNDDIPF